MWNYLSSQELRSSGLSLEGKHDVSGAVEPLRGRGFDDRDEHDCRMTRGDGRPIPNTFLLL